MIERQFLTERELVALQRGSIFCYDVESFQNYWLVAYKHLQSGKYAYIESIDTERVQGEWLQWMADTFCLVGFNCIFYDNTVCSAAASDKFDAAALQALSFEIIEQNSRPWQVAKARNFKLLEPNQIDLIEVAPLQGSLKTYAARLHCGHMQDLPFDPNKVLSREEIAIVREYCFNDLDNTELLLGELSPHLELRAALSHEFQKDLRSRSDAQLAQEIICSEIERLTGKRPHPIDFTKLVGTGFCYTPPSYIQFSSAQNNAILSEICEAEIEIGHSGHVVCPKTIEGRKFIIAEKAYAIGMGGLHSRETCQAVTNEMHRIIDRDVTGYYPNLILKNKFSDIVGLLDALQNIVDRRYKAKKLGDKVTADSLKIATNGTFGKMSDPFSPFYSPMCMVQTTLTGQLSLLMAIEALAQSGIEVISANTDGIVSLVHSEQYRKFCEIWKQWETLTGLETEETEYKALYSRDVNNYIAVKLDNTTKAKGVYSYVGSALNSPLSKNPENLVCIDAVIAHIVSGKPIADTIAECRAMERFCTVRKVTGGAQKDGKYLGKTIRYYYSKSAIGSIVYCKNGNKVPNSDGAKPLMTLPDCFPDDIDYARYAEIAVSMLEDIGFQKRRNSQLTML